MTGKKTFSLNLLTEKYCTKITNWCNCLKILYFSLIIIIIIILVILII